jgi:hypothetical protein
LFSEAQSFNQDIGNWQTDSEINMAGMFASSGTVNLNGGMSFNQDLSGWKVDNVFQCSGFNALGILSNRDVWTLPKPNFTQCTP